MTPTDAWVEIAMVLDALRAPYTPQWEADTYSVDIDPSWFATPETRRALWATLERLDTLAREAVK